MTHVRNYKVTDLVDGHPMGTFKVPNDALAALHAANQYHHECDYVGLFRTNRWFGREDKFLGMVPTQAPCSS